MKPTKEKTMEAIYLQSMTDFVLKIDGIVKQPEDQDTDDWSLSCFSVIENYANFLKQPLKLGFFVPCDENGNVLDPSDVFKSCEKGFLYGKAKEKVLFEGFEYVKFINDGELSPYHRLVKNDEYFNVRFLDRNIEDLLTEFEYGIELTPTAIKQIGL